MSSCHAGKVLLGDWRVENDGQWGATVAWSGRLDTPRVVTDCSGGLIFSQFDFQDSFLFRSGGGGVDDKAGRGGGWRRSKS